MPQPTPQPAPSPPTIDPGWRRALATWLATHRRYPDQARQRGEQGAVGLAFTVARNGTVLDVAIQRSSGSEALDQAALEMLRNQTLPGFPPDMPQDRTTVSVTVRYALE